MKWCAVLLFLLQAASALAQSSQVYPSELSLDVTIADSDVAPYEQEMILITIHGQYRRHITLEKLEQPKLDGFNWMQLGPDQWYETTERGKKVKNFKRRMALYPDRAGKLTIGAFTHHLTLTDEGDDWFAHDIASAPITVEVLPAPPVEGWWFPVRRLEISDGWSNAPTQLKPGEGVLRVVRVEAVGVPPDMIPPMPELRSPTAMIFAHPEKRLVELSPYGPVSVAFWRWTIRPGSDTSSIVEPISFDYFDTTHRVARSVTISPQRVAMDDSTLPAPVTPPAPVRLWRGLVLGVFMAALAAGCLALLLGRRFVGTARLTRVGPFDPLRRALRRAARRRDLAALRRAAAALIARDPANTARSAMLRDLDRHVFAPEGAGRPLDARGFARDFLAAT